ncbi:hypothetical protein T06_13383, partial [Trichinella sp. T6]
ILSCQRQDSSSANFASDEEPVFSNFANATNVEACFRFSCNLRPLKVLNVRQHAVQTYEVAAGTVTSESSGVTVAGAGTLFATFLQ